MKFPYTVQVCAGARTLRLATVYLARCSGTWTAGDDGAAGQLGVGLLRVSCRLDGDSSRPSRMRAELQHAESPAPRTHRISSPSSTGLGTY